MKTQFARALSLFLLSIHVIVGCNATKRELAGCCSLQHNYLWDGEKTESLDSNLQVSINGMRFSIFEVRDQRKRFGLCSLGNERSMNLQLGTNGRMYLAGGLKRTCVALMLDPKIAVPNLTSGETKKLLGVHLKGTEKHYADILQHVNAERCLVYCDFEREREPDLSILPDNLQAVAISSFVYGYSHFPEKLRNTRFLFLETQDVDIADFKQLSRLEVLTCEVRSLENMEQLAALAELKELHVRFATITQKQAIELQTAVNALPFLHTLSLRHCDSVDLSGMTAELDFLDLNSSWISHLPKATISTLRVCELYGARYSEDELQLFKRLNPQCEFRSDWEALLKNILKQSDAMIVYDNDSPAGSKSFVIRDVGIISSFGNSLELEGPSTHIGFPEVNRRITFVFYRWGVETCELRFAPFEFDYFHARISGSSSVVTYGLSQNSMQKIRDLVQSNALQKFH